MEQYKVILVDDEVEVIDIMKQKIRWNDLGFDVVGSATNGVKALELVEKLQPDVVLTDAEGALEALGELNGKHIREDLVDTIFSRFCVGK